MKDTEDVIALEAPPRTLEVKHFAKARAAELLSLHAALKKRKAAREEENQDKSKKDSISLPRHLRRRTSSYTHRRCPLPWLYKQKKRTTAHTKSSSLTQSALHPEKKARVQRKESHVDSTERDLNLRLEKEGNSDQCKRKRLCRSLRRLLELKPGGLLVANDGTRRLSTHVWHAKRFSMEKKFGYYLPIGRPGKGRGARAILRWSKTDALLQDSSFYSAIQIHGEEEKLLQIMRQMLELPKTSNSDCGIRQQELSGESFTTALLHHAGEAPYRLIAPIVVLWKPFVLMHDIQMHQRERDLWIWVHGAAFEEAFQALQLTCRKVESESGVSIGCFSRREGLGMLDLVGEKSFAILQKVVFPLERDDAGKCRKLRELVEVINPDVINGKTVFSFEVCDPRLNSSEKLLIPDPSSLKEKESNISSSFGEVVCHDFIDRTPEAENNHRYCPNVGVINALWSSDSYKVRPPLRDKFLSKMRHLNRLHTFGLSEPSTSNNGRKLEISKTLRERSACPILLLKHDGKKPSARGWSVILPLSWIGTAFWVPLVFAGGHVIGVRERHWLHTDAGYPSFPSDFPDTATFRRLASSSEASEGLPRRCTKRRKLKREPLLASFETVCELPMQLTSCSPSCEARDDSELPITNLPFHGPFIARTAHRLATHLQATDQSNLLLFPRQMEGKEKFDTLGKRLLEGTVAWRIKSGTSSMGTDRICLVRVLIQPFHKGVAEVGAILYSPTSEDYAIWSEMEGRLKSASFGSKHDKSERGVGFVTSKAPYGSNHGVSIAFCDAAALGRLRGRQWVETSWCKTRGIFLMFCNENSSAFRPAFASIVIEETPDM